MRLFEGTPFDRPPRCEVCDELEEDCVCPPPEPVSIPASEQSPRISVEKRKKGKQVTVVRGLPEEGNDLPGLLTQLKSHCGAGGTLKDAEIEIQGNHADRLKAWFKTQGYRV